MKRLTGILAVVAVLALAVSAQATTMIGANFVGDGGVLSYRTLDAADVAGVVPHANWNNITGGSGGPVALNDSTGSDSGATMTWSSHATGWSITGDFGNVPSNTTEKLLDGFVYSYTEGPVTVTVDNVPYGLYDAYIYVDPNGDVVTEKITVGTTDWYSTGTLYWWGGSENHLVYTEVTSHDPDNPTMDGTYVHVTGLTSSSFSFTTWGVNTAHTPGCFGFQLVEIPEPATMALMALGGVGLVAIRRRR